MKMSILIRSYAKDMEWLGYCLRSLKKYAKGFHEIVVVLPTPDAWMQDCFPGMATFRVTPVYCSIGYLDQQITKIYSDEFCEGATHCFHMDDDCLAVRDFSPQEFFIDDKPMLPYRTWDQAEAAICWKEPTEASLKLPPRFEFLPTFPLVYKIETYAHLRKYMQSIHGVEPRKWIAEQKSFCEFNTIGNFIYQFEHSEYDFIPVHANDKYPRPIRQYWSHQDINLVREEMEIICR